MNVTRCNCDAVHGYRYLARYRASAEFATVPAYAPDLEGSSPFATATTTASLCSYADCTSSASSRVLACEACMHGPRLAGQWPISTVGPVDLPHFDKQPGHYRTGQAEDPKVYRICRSSPKLTFATAHMSRPGPHSILAHVHGRHYHHTRSPTDPRTPAKPSC